MKTIILALATLATLSTASLAGQRTDVDARDRFVGDVNSVSASHSAPAGSVSYGSAAFAIEGTESVALSAFERVTLRSIMNENSPNK